MGKIRVGILGATGTVGQRFVAMLEEHPQFVVTALALRAPMNPISLRNAGLYDSFLSRWT